MMSAVVSAPYESIADKIEATSITKTEEKKKRLKPLKLSTELIFSDNGFKKLKKDMSLEAKGLQGRGHEVRVYLLIFF